MEINKKERKKNLEDKGVIRGFSVTKRRKVQSWWMFYLTIINERTSWWRRVIVSVWRRWRKCRVVMVTGHGLHDKLILFPSLYYLLFPLNISQPYTFLLFFVSLCFKNVKFVLTERLLRETRKREGEYVDMERKCNISEVHIFYEGPQNPW